MNLKTIPRRFIYKCECGKYMSRENYSLAKCRQVFTNNYRCRDCQEVFVFRTRSHSIRDMERVYGRDFNAKPCPLYTRFMRNPDNLSVEEIEHLLNSDIMGCSDVFKR